MTDIWAACAGQARPGPLGGGLVRIVESQEQVATLALVQTLAEQALLEQMIDDSKPPRRPGTEGLHYLLATPFRYPPLSHGSRFGSRWEPGLFYGARDVPGALAEAAYYRYYFWTGMETPPPSGALATQHTVFGASWRTGTGLRLQDPPFDAHRALIASPVDYTATQALGANLRAAGVEAFEYPSARDPRGGVNVALFEPRAVASRAPEWRQEWLCETRDAMVRFWAKEAREPFAFPLTTFLVDGRFPVPSG